MAEVLNLNNEVVRMRKVVKTARVLIIRKLARHIVSLKKRKGNEAEVEKNQRRAARLLEEIHEMKSLKPDHVTKAALMKDLNFENVCKNPSSTLSERATARLATHPQISKKIQEIKAAIKAFKDERRKPAEGKPAEGKPGKPAEQPKMDAIKSDKEEEEEDGSDDGADDDADDDDDDDDDGDGGVCPDDGDVEDEGEEKEEGVGAAMDGSSPAKEEPTVKTGDDIIETASKSELRGPSEEVEMQPEEKPETLIKQQKAVDPAHKLDDSKTQPTQDKKTQKPTENKPPPQCPSNSRVEIKGPRAKGEEEEEESDLDSSDDDEEEKEYFDDSTEERFRKQSSQSEGSDEEDDFFLGKVSKFKKRKTGPGVAGKNNSDRNVSRANALEAEAEGQCGDEGRGQKNSKAAKLESVFCTTLSGSRGAHGNRGRGSSGISKPHGFQNERRGQGRTQKPAPFQNRGGSQDGKSTASKFQNQKRGGFRGGPRVQDRGPAPVRARPQFENPRDHRAAAGRASNPSQHAQQALHPSWEASKRRREQQAQITAFQGKKIKFDDD